MRSWCISPAQFVSDNMLWKKWTENMWGTLLPNRLNYLLLSQALFRKPFRGSAEFLMVSIPNLLPCHAIHANSLRNRVGRSTHYLVQISDTTSSFQAAKRYATIIRPLLTEHRALPDWWIVKLPFDNQQDWHSSVGALSSRALWSLILVLANSTTVCTSS